MLSIWFVKSPGRHKHFLELEERHIEPSEAGTLSHLVSYPKKTESLDSDGYGPLYSLHHIHM